MTNLEEFLNLVLLLCICSFTHAWDCLWKPEEHGHSPGAGVAGNSTLLWVLGTKSRSFERVTCTLNYLVLSLSPGSILATRCEDGAGIVVQT